MSRKFAIACPGQGSQHHGMLDALPSGHDADRLLDAAEALTGLALRDVASAGTPEQLADTRAAQPLLYLTDWAWGAALLDAGVGPVVLAGHSLGELAALALAGVYSVEAGLELVVERSRLMAECARSTPGGMAAVLGLEGPAVAAVTAGMDGVWLANDNAPGQVVLSGTEEGLALASAALSSAGARRIVPLNVAGPFHSPLMRPAADAFAEMLRETQFEDAGVPVISNFEPAPSTDAATIRERLSTQMVSPVRWTETMEAMMSLGVETLVEAGPGSVLKGLTRRVERLDGVCVEEGGISAVLEEVTT